mmetsp:Transcript_52127/g.138394  ORF Transcript_52127/g.138394 Transcript_52127/m.138394 type:complete len:453 (-) Transcript_52127:122-1480(-)
MAAAAAARLLAVAAAVFGKVGAARAPNHPAGRAPTAEPQQAVSMAQTDGQGGDGADALSGQFSATASQAMENLSRQLAQFQRMVAARSSQFQSELQEQDRGNRAQEAANRRIQASNSDLEAENHALERRARALVNSNKQLRRELKGLDLQLHTAQSLAAAVDAFTAKDDTAHKNGDEDYGDGLDLKMALVSVSASASSRAEAEAGVTTESRSLADGAKDLVQQERLSVTSLQQSFEAAAARGRAQQAQLLQDQKKLNATHDALLVRRGRLEKLGARLQAAHDHMRARAQRLGAFLQQLAGIANPGPGAAQGPAAAAGQQGSKATAPASSSQAAAARPASTAVSLPKAAAPARSSPRPQPQAPAVAATPRAMPRRVRDAAAAAPAAALPQQAPRRAQAALQEAEQPRRASALQVGLQPRPAAAVAAPVARKPAPPKDADYSSKLDSVLDMLKR